MPAIEPALERGPDRPDPRLRLAFLGLALVGLVAVFAGPLVGLVVLTLAGGAVLLAERYGRPLWATTFRADGASRKLRPWPHVKTLPIPLAGTELLDAQACGLVWHRPTGLMSVTVLLTPCPTALREPAVAEAYAACWWALLESACETPEIVAAALTVDVLPSGGQQPLRLTLTVDPGVRGPVRSVARAAERTVEALREVDVAAAGLAHLRVAGADDLARITRAALEPRCRWLATDAAPIAWGELAPGTEAELARVYRHERYGSISWALHVPARQHPRAETIPALLSPGRRPRRVTLVEWQGPHESTRSVFVTTSIARPAEIEPARAEVENLVRTAQPRLELCRDRQAAAFAVGLPLGWFPPHPLERRYEVFR